MIRYLLVLGLAVSVMHPLYERAMEGLVEIGRMQESLIAASDRSIQDRYSRIVVQQTQQAPIQALNDLRAALGNPS